MKQLRSLVSGSGKRMQSEEGTIQVEIITASVLKQLSEVVTKFKLNENNTTELSNSSRFCCW